MINAQLAATTIHRRRHPSCKTPTSHGGGVGEIHGVPPTCLGEVSDLSDTSPRRLGEVSGKSRTSRGSLGEVRVMEFGLYGDISILRNPISLPFAILDLLGKS